MDQSDESDAAGYARTRHTLEFARMVRANSRGGGGGGGGGAVSGVGFRGCMLLCWCAGVLVCRCAGVLLCSDWPLIP